ncbi:MAG: reverse transcriptase domain-containing protein, partial [Betaproteobacteria bacterium]
MRPTTALHEGAVIPYDTLFPPRDDQVIIHAQVGNPGLPTLEEIDQAIAAADRTSAAGLSGLSFAHLKDLRLFDAAALTLTALRVLTATTTPLAAKTFLRSHHVIPFPKPGSTEARPIAIPDSLMRIWSAATARTARSQLNAALLPFQLGTGASCAPEVATFTIRTLLDSDKSKMVLKTDFTNAYGLLSRQAILTGLRLLKAPEPVLDYFGFVYGTPVPLMQGGKLAAHASTGLIQGDPLSPLCFSVGIHPMLLS